jgi:D-3-phosphoglycerate dehydrogenase
LLNFSRKIEGTVFGTNELRITKIDGYGIDLPPAEHMLLFNNYDEPGVLKKIVEKLASAKINIAHFSLGRKVEGFLLLFFSLVFKIFFNCCINAFFISSV